jgi:Na+/melibiose symporter-like transporter
LQKWLLSEVHPTIVVEAPYLVLIPTMLLAAGMLMFFTLGSSMVGDVCDEDELKTGTRSEGTYYSVFWWFIKMGTAFASFVTGALLVFTNFDETQNKSADELAGNLAVIEAEAELWLTQQAVESAQLASLAREIENAIENADKLTNHFRKRSESLPDQASHAKSLAERAESIHSQALVLQSKQVALAANPTELVHQAEQMLAATIPLRQQSQLTLFRLRLVEIGMPLALSIVSIALMLRYPLNEARCYEIKEALKKRRAEASA